MKFNDFITAYKKDNTVLSKHIKIKYLPFERKMAVCKNIIDFSMYKNVEINGVTKKVLAINSPNQYFLMTMTLIREYTDIELPEKTEEWLPIFNTIEELGISEQLDKAIGRDFITFNTILKMSIDDTIFAETNLNTYLDSKLDSISLMLDAYQSAFSEVTKDNVISINQDKE